MASGQGAIVSWHAWEPTGVECRDPAVIRGLQRARHVFESTRLHACTVKGMSLYHAFAAVKRLGVSLIATNFVSFSIYLLLTVITLVPQLAPLSWCSSLNRLGKRKWEGICACIVGRFTRDIPRVPAYLRTWRQSLDCLSGLWASAVRSGREKAARCPKLSTWKEWDWPMDTGD